MCSFNIVELLVSFDWFHKQNVIAAWLFGFVAFLADKSSILVNKNCFGLVPTNWAEIVINNGLCFEHAEVLFGFEFFVLD